jgi:hypothetical protein
MIAYHTAEGADAGTERPVLVEKRQPSLRFSPSQRWRG